MITEFQKKVYSLCRKIPKGRVSTYGNIAKVLGIGKIGSRAVGNALNKNPFAPAVPCHRVVKSNGDIGGFACGVKKKISLLKTEGICIYGNRIVDFEKKVFKF